MPNIYTTAQQGAPGRHWFVMTGTYYSRVPTLIGRLFGRKKFTECRITGCQAAKIVKGDEFHLPLDSGDVERMVVQDVSYSEWVPEMFFAQCRSVGLVEY